MSDDAEDLLDELGLGAPALKEPMFVRDLTESDLISSWVTVPYGTKPSLSLIKKLRFPHHTLARLVADGKSHPECSAITGYAVGSIVAYLKDPAFRELVEFYKNQASQQYIDVHSRLAGVGTMALEILQDRLEEEPDKVTTSQLREIVNDMYDRSVAPTKAGAGSAGGNGNEGPKVINIHFGQAQPLPIAHNAPLVIEHQSEVEKI